MSRSRPALRPPNETAHDFTKFPRKTHRADTTWYHQHNDRPADADRGAWYFASHTVGDVSEGRFDLDEPGGTCYLANSERGAMFECIGPEYADRGWVDAGLVEGVSCHLCRFRTTSKQPMRPRPGPAISESRTNSTLGMTTRPRRRGHRCCTMPGSGGLHYELRFSPGSARGLALFGPAGAPNPKPAGDPDPVNLREFVERLGVEVIEPPTMTAVRIILP